MSDYIKNIATLSGGTLVSQIILVLSVPIIAIIYSPEAFGFAAYFIACGSILSALSTGKYDFAIFSPKDKIKSIQFLFGSIIINVLFTLTISLIVLFIPVLRNDYSHYVLATIALVFLNGLNLSLTAWFNTNKKYSIISIGRIIKNLFLSLSGIILGLYFSTDPIYLILSNVVGMAVFNLFYVVLFILKYSSSIQYFILPQIFKLLKENLDFPKYSLPASIINVLSSQSPVILLKILYGDSIAGIYALVNKIMGAPSQLIANSTAEVYREKASKLYNMKGDCEKLFLKTFRGLFFIGIIPFIIIIAFGPSLFSVIFGVEWIESGYFARYLAIFFFLRFCISPLSFTLIIANKQNYNLSWQSFLFLNTTLGMICGYLNDSYMMSLVAFSLIYSIMYIFYFIEIKKSAKGNH